MFSAARSQRLPANSTLMILNKLHDDPFPDIVELIENPIPIEAAQIPAHFRPTAKKIIETLLATHGYTAISIQNDNVTWVSKVEPFKLTRTSRHPSTAFLDGEPRVFNEIITNVDAVGKVNYQVKAFDGTCHYIHCQLINDKVVLSNHLRIVSPTLSAIAEENDIATDQHPRRKLF